MYTWTFSTQSNFIVLKFQAVFVLVHVYMTKISFLRTAYGIILEF